jgi:transcriptional regulator with XRE-family HTH domain
MKARVDAGLTQAQVAKRMKTSQAAIARMEGGKSNRPRVYSNGMRKPLAGGCAFRLSR